MHNEIENENVNVSKRQQHTKEQKTVEGHYLKSVNKPSVLVSFQVTLLNKT